MEETIRKVFCDTSFFYAALDRNDFDHDRAVSLSRWIKENNVAAITTWEVIVETITLLRYRLSFKGAGIFMKTVLPNLNVIYITDSERAKALDMFLRLSSDKKLSLCDIISYVVVREHLQGIPCIAFDDDFKALGLRVFQRV